MSASSENLHRPDVTVPDDWMLAVPRGENQEGQYSNMFVTHGTLAMDRAFGLDFAKPGEVTKEAAYQLKFALLFSPISAESTRVAEHFVGIAKFMNHFLALPIHEIPKVSGGAVTSEDLERAIQEGYAETVQSSICDKAVQLTPKLGPKTLPQDKRVTS